MRGQQQVPVSALHVYVIHLIVSDEIGLASCRVLTVSAVLWQAPALVKLQVLRHAARVGRSERTERTLVRLLSCVTSVVHFEVVCSYYLRNGI